MVTIITYSIEDEGEVHLDPPEGTFEITGDSKSLDSEGDTTITIRLRRVA
jgi:hypothetical protein